MKKRLSLLLTFVLLVALLAAWGSLGAASAYEGIDTSISADLDYMVWHPNIPDTVALQVEHFNEIYPNVNVNIIMMTGSGTFENLQPRIAANDIPDILSVDPIQWVWELADNGLLGDLSPTKAWQNMYQSCRDAFTSPKNGVAYGIPYGICSSMIFYNVDAFKAAGITENPTNFDEFLETCQKLKDAGFTPLVWYGGFTNMLSHTSLSWGIANDIVAYEPDAIEKIKTGTYDYTSENNARTYEKMLQLVNGGYVNEGYMSTDNQPGMRLFMDGDCAMIWYGTWSAATFFDDEDCEFEINTMVPPWNDAGMDPIGVLSPETGWGIANNDNYELNLRLLDFIAFDDYVITQNAEKNIPIYPESIMPGTIVDPRTTQFVDAMAPFRQIQLAYQIMPVPVFSYAMTASQEILINLDVPTAMANLNAAQAEWLAEQ